MSEPPTSLSGARRSLRACGARVALFAAIGVGTAHDARAEMVGRDGGPPRTQAVDATSSTTPADAHPEDVDAVRVLVGEVQGDWGAARDHLRAHPQRCAPALRARLGDGTLDPSQRRRILHLWVSISPEAARADIDAQARAAAASGQPLDPWLKLLARLPDGGESTLIALVGDRRLDARVRQELLVPLIENTSDPGRFVALVGQGEVGLERALRRRIRSRARMDPKAREVIVAALVARLEAPSPPPQVILLLGAVSPTPATVRARLVSLAVHEDTPFPAAIAAVDTLARAHASGVAPGEAPVEGLAEPLGRRLRAAPGDATTLLVALALPAMPPAKARALVREHDLLTHHDPRMVEAAVRLLSTLEPPVGAAEPPAWWHVAMRNPWPKVRLAALDTLRAPCAPAFVEDAAALIDGASPRDGEAARLIRGGVRALGRCATKGADILEEIASDRQRPAVIRADAAVALLSAAPDRVDVVTRLLRGDERLASLILELLASVPSPPEGMAETLCDLAGAQGRLRPTALRLIRRWRLADECAPVEPGPT